MDQNNSEMHSPIQSVIFHLFPGILIGGFYFLVRNPIMNLGYPPVFALILAVVFILIPVELGYLLYQGKKKRGRFTLDGVISYRKSIPWWQNILWVLIVFVATGLIFTVLKPLDTLLQEKLFYWIPAIGNGLDGTYSRTVLIVTYSLFFVFIVLLGPLVEELYFRGYLLPRMQGRFAALFHSFLFAAYHVFTPWMIITRMVGLLPLIYTIRKKNIYIGMIVHILVNSLDMITAIAFISSMTR